MAQLKQAQANLSKENGDHARRAETLVKEDEELKRELSEIKIERRINQGKLETSVASIKSLTEERMSQITALMTQRDQQADERMKFISEALHCRDIDIDKRIVNLMITVQDFTQGVKAVVATVPSRPSRVPVALNPTNVSVTSTSLPQQPTYKEVVQRETGSKPDQTKQSKLQPPGTFRRIPAKGQVTTASRTELQHCETSGFSSFDPYARGASTTEDYYSAASGLMTKDTRTSRGDTEYQTAVSSKPNTKQPTLFATQDQMRPITTASSKGLEPKAAKETKNKPTKHRGTRDGVVDGWLMLMKRYLEKAHANDTPLDRARTIVEFLENKAQDYITNKSEAERETDETVFSLLARRCGTGTNKIQIQQQFRTRNHCNNED